VKADQRKRRRYLGGIVPFGWQVTEDGALVEDPDEQRAIQRIRQLRGEGLSLGPSRPPGLPRALSYRTKA
jgi:hypothetical protein